MPNLNPQSADSRYPAVCILALAVYAALSLYRVGAPDLGADEARLGIAARNLLHDGRQWAIVSPDPRGVPWSTWPYGYPALLAASIALLGPTAFALRVVDVVMLAIAAYCIYRTGWLIGRQRAVATGAFLFFLLGPATVTYARLVIPEVPVVVWGCVALAMAAKYRDSGRPVHAVLCGMALGLGFLSKLWLVLPFCPASVWLIVTRYPASSRRAIARDALFTVAAFLVVSVTHLLLLRLLAPEHLQAWLAIYFESAMKSRVGGAGYDPQMWFKPWWFYLGGFFKGTFFCLPLLLLGARHAVRRRLFALLGCVAFLFAPLLLLSLMNVKQASYAYPAYPGAALLAGCGLACLAAKPVRSEILVSAFVSACFAGLAFAAGLVSASQCAVMFALYALYMVLGLSVAAARYPAAQTWSLRAVASLSIVILLAADVVVLQRGLSERTFLREVALWSRSHSGAPGSSTVSFTAPEYPSIGFYTFQLGEYWNTFYFHKPLGDFERELQNRERQFYVVDPSGRAYGGSPGPRELDLLARYTRDVTPEIERESGVRIPLRVFVPKAALRP